MCIRLGKGLLSILLLLALSVPAVPALAASPSDKAGVPPVVSGFESRVAQPRGGIGSDTSIQPSGEAEGKEITLITGDVVAVSSQPGGPRTLTVRSADPTKGSHFQTLDTPEGSYVIPNHVDLEKLDMELFNVEYLVQEGYSQLPGLPVIIEFKEKERFARALESVTTMVVGLGAQITGSSLRLAMLAAQLPFDTIDRSCQGLLARPDVEKIWLDRRVHVELNESVPLIGAPQCWDAGYDGTGVKIAILDTGIDATHPDLDDLDDNPATTDPKVIVERDFTTDNYTADLHGHGTHCAGIAAGTGQASEYTYTGVAPRAQLLNVKVMTSQGWGQDSWIIAGIEYATLGPDGVADTGDEADILSMSFGADWNGDGTDPLSLAVDWATGQGAICVVAAGNAGPGMSTVGTPAVARTAITVGATTKADTMADFSSRGPTADLRLKPDVVAPGVGIVAPRASGTSMGAPVNDFYTSASGTSMATPLVAGAAALVLHANPTWEPGMVKSALMGYAKVIENAELRAQGGGRIQVLEASEATLLALDPSLSFGRLGLGDVQSANLTLMNLGNASITASIATYTTCEGVETDYASVTPESVEIPAGGSSVVSVQAGPLDELAPEGWYEGRVIISYDGETLRVPYLFGAFSTITAAVYDTDNTTKIWAAMVLATYPDMEFTAHGGEWGSQFRAASGDYALLASCGWIEQQGKWPPDVSRMFMIEGLVTVPKLSDVNVRLSLAEADVSEISTVNGDGDDLITHYYTQYFSGEPYYEELVGKTMMRWSMGSAWAGFDITVPALTFYSSEYDPPDKLSEAFGYYASDNLLCGTYLPSDLYLLNWKYWNVSLLPPTVAVDPLDLARYSFLYDMPETYPENGLNTMNGFWFTWEYLGDLQGLPGDNHPVLAGMNATYYLAPETATYWGYYMPTYGGWGSPEFGPMQGWNVGQHWPYPQIPLEKGETGNITLEEFQFAPYVPGLSLQVSPGGGPSTVELTGEIWAGLTWSHLQWQTGGVPVSPYPPNRTPRYEFYVDGVETGSGSLGRPDGTWYNGLWWNDVSQSWNATGERGLLRVHMPTLATISNWSTYEVDFGLSGEACIPPLFDSIVVPASYSPGEAITIELQTADSITALTLEYSFDQGTTWQVAEETAGGYLIPTEMADALSVRMTGLDVNGNSLTYVSDNVSLSEKVKLCAPDSVGGAPGKAVKISGNLTTIGGKGLKGLAVSMSDNETTAYTSPKEEGDFTFSYEVYEVPHEIAIASPTAGAYRSTVVSVEIVEDTTPPTVSTVFPEDGATDVPVNAVITVTFSEPMSDPSAPVLDISPYVGGSTYWSANTMTFVPATHLAYNTTYTVTIGTNAQDLAGNPLAAPYSWSFATELPEVVDFPDPNLEAAIREAIGKPTGEIYRFEVEGLTELDAPFRGIVDLTGLENCSNLSYLVLSYNQIGDIGPLSSLASLNWLGLALNHISDIGPLSGLTRLTALELAANQISDIEPLVNNPGIDNGDYVNLYWNPLDCVSLNLYGPQLAARGACVVYDMTTPPRDVNCDGCINVQDVILVGQHFGEGPTAGGILEDVNRDGVINVLDLILVGQHFGEGCS